MPYSSGSKTKMQLKIIPAHGTVSRTPPPRRTSPARRRRRATANANANATANANANANANAAPNLSHVFTARSLIALSCLVVAAAAVPPTSLPSAAFVPSSLHHRRRHHRNIIPAAAAEPATFLSAYTDGSDRTAPIRLPVPSSPVQPAPTLPNGGRVTLVGSGPGDPDLLTLAAHRVITDPDALVIVDRLVSDEIVSLIRGEYKIANKHPGCQETAQEEIYTWVQEGLKAGRHVVRLKIGDPFVFGRGGEEVIKFRGFGVESKVIPGVSAAFSAPLLGSIPVTHRGVANQVVMCTGYGRNNTSPDLIQYHREQTVVFLMAVGRLRELCHRLETMAGFPAGTPVGIVERAGCPDQRTVVGTIETIADIAEEHDVRPPSTIVVGEVVRVLLDRGNESGEAIMGLVQDCAAGVEVA